jgi:hypothetical protein
MVRAELGFRMTGEYDELAESPLCSIEMPSGWYLIVSNRSELVAPPEAMQRISSSGAELVTCFVEEHVMVSSATAWKGGRQLWSVVHDAQQKRDHLAIEGEVPTCFDAILNRLRDEQRQANAEKRGVDYIFDVPVELARALVGYRHDQDIPDLKGSSFAILSGEVPSTPISIKKPSFFKRWFGGQ